jgi:drug/metabolite transporter (DMT)-like permease
MSRNAVLFALMCLVWGLTWLPVKIGAQHVPPIFLACARFTIAGTLMLAWAGRDVLTVPRDAWARVVATALLLNTGNYTLLFWGTAQSPSGLAAIVNFATIPLFTIIASRLIEGHGIGLRKLAAIGLGSLGLGFLFATRALGGFAAAGNPLEFWGLAAVAGGTLLYCFGAVWSRPLMRRMPMIALAGWQTLIGGAGLACMSVLLEDVSAADIAALAAWPTAPSLAFLVVGGSLIGFTAYMRLVRDWGAFRAGLYAFISPAIAVAAGVLALGEPFGLAEAIGSLLMFGAAAIALRR